ERHSTESSLRSSAEEERAQRRAAVAVRGAALRAGPPGDPPVGVIRVYPCLSVAFICGLYLWPLSVAFLFGLYPRSWAVAGISRVVTSRGLRARGPAPLRGCCRRRGPGGRRRPPSRRGP